MARHRQASGIFDAIPGAGASLRWRGWAGVALLVIPAVVLAVLAVTAVDTGNGHLFGWLAVVAGCLALVAAGCVMARTLAGLRRMSELARVLSEHANGPVFVKDARHRYRFANAEAALLTGRSAGDLVGRSDGELHPGPAALAFEENDRVCLDRDLPTLFRESAHTEDGEASFLVGKYPLHDTRGRVSGLVGIARDITGELELQKLTRRRTDETRVWFDQNPLPVVAFAGDDQHIVNVNRAALEAYGYERAQMLELRLRDLFAPEESERLQAYLRRERRGLPPGAVPWRHRRANGKAFEVLTNMGSLPHEAESMHLMLVRDVSVEQGLRGALATAEGRYEDLIESGLAMVWMHDLDGRLLRVNRELASALGFERDQMVGRLLSDFVAEEAHNQWEDYMDRVHSLKRDAGLLQVVSRNGERRVWQYQFVWYPDAQPAPYVLGTAQDVTLRHRHELRMRDQNRRDPLTGCHTRRYLDVFALQAGIDQAWGCVVVDLDFFRQLNASEGHARGDQVLRELAQLLRSRAHPGDEVVRIDADEFVVLLPHATVDAVRELAERLAAASRDGMPAVFSIGWAVREGGESLESTLRRADKQLLRSRARTQH